jgi:hypothetical protein
MYQPVVDSCVVPKTNLKDLIKKAVNDQFMDILDNAKHFPVETNKALDYSYSDLQSISDYIKITNFEIDQFMFDKFGYELTESDYIYIDADIMDWLGYDHVNKQKNFSLEIEDFKEFVSGISLERARQIDEYCLAIKRLITMYDEYREHFNLRKHAPQDKDRLIFIIENLKL